MLAMADLMHWVTVTERVTESSVTEVADTNSARLLPAGKRKEEGVEKMREREECYFT